MRQMKYRRDPAPSVLSYRLGRLWLTPSFRRIVKWGPVATIALGALFYVLTSERFQSSAADFFAEARQKIVGREEFKVASMRVRGASEALRVKVEQTANVQLPISSLEIDLVELRQKIETLPQVSSAAVRVGAGGILQITLAERVPAVVWRTANGLNVLSADGVTLGQISSRLDRADLPLIAGQGAEDRIEEALDLLSIASVIEDRVRGLQRVGARRWNLVLNHGLEVFLPEDGARTALMRVMAIHASEGLLDKDIKVVDLRLPKRPTVQLGAYAASELKPTALVSEETPQ